MPHCDHCQTHVSKRFARVFADGDGVVRACPACTATAGIAGVVRHRSDAAPNRR